MEPSKVAVSVPAGFDMASLVGPQDRYLRKIEECFDASIVVRGNTITLSGDPIEMQILSSLLSDCIKYIEDKGDLSEDYLTRSIELLRSGELDPAELRKDILLTHRGKTIRPKTAGQKRYTDAVKANTITFAIGPAGTGKTYLAMAMAVAALRRKEVARIILTRPVVEAGESLGYLPGTLTEKVDPYVRPLYDALFDMCDAQKVNVLIDQGTIEIAPLAYMRGRTLNDSFVILDEAQNTTPEQMKMFLTRLGFGSKMIVTGDITQIDLPRGVSGLKSIRGILEGLEGIAFCDLKSADVVRHNLVQRIVAAYDKAAAEKNGVR
ncbi:MAG: PhoH family protein [Coriobacteriales bacterium]|nr:PhoH family protein [Coriobacteriales bacterium]